jgi:DNA-binding NarL/FixJ family response regulator
MPHSKAEMLGIAERRATVAELLAEGKRQCEIAAALGLNKMTVSRDIAAIDVPVGRSSLGR